MKVYVCPVCGNSFMPNTKIYTYKQPSAGEPIPCVNHNGEFLMVLPLASPFETDALCDKSYEIGNYHRKECK